MKQFYLIFIAYLIPTGFLNAQGIMGTEDQREAGKAIYDQKCAQCHGYNGDAASVAKEYFRPQPRDFTIGIYKFRTTSNGELPTHDDIKRSIKNGMPYTGMPAWPNFSNNELDNLAYYIKSFYADFEEYGTDVNKVNLPSPPSYNESNLERGRTVFQENQCIDCHGNFGRGDGPSAPTLTDQTDQTIRPADLTKRWTFRGGASRGDIYRTFMTGLDGSPMPSYDNIADEGDRWALVDYVYSLGESDEANYATAVIAEGRRGDIDISQGESLFQNATKAMFPVAGQVIEPGRSFYPGVNAVEVSAVCNEEEVAIMLSWHDMSAETNGSNSPALDVPLFDADALEAVGSNQFSDAVAVMVPSKTPETIVKPYIMFGDKKNSMDIWFADLAADGAKLFTGKGQGNIEESASEITATSSYEEGRWTVIFKRSRMAENGLSFDEGTFVPIAFSVWDGFNHERGNKRGLTSWYNIYLSPLERESPVGPMAKSAIMTFLLLMAIVIPIRLKYKDKV